MLDQMLRGEDRNIPRLSPAPSTAQTDLQKTSGRHDVDVIHGDSSQSQRTARAQGLLQRQAPHPGRHRMSPPAASTCRTSRSHHYDLPNAPTTSSTA